MGRSFSMCKCVWLFFGLGAAAILAPALRAEDAVEILKRTLKEGTLEQVAKDTDSLKLLSDLRRGYFLSEWPRESLRELDSLQKELEKKKEQNAPQIAQVVHKRELLKIRGAMGDRLAQRIRGSAMGNEDRQIAACIMVAELAETEEPQQRAVKFAARFSEMLVGTKTAKGLVHSRDVRVRQAALHALGKITPLPGAAMPALRSVLKEDELGPRRLAAYALIDLVKNAAFLPREEEMATINQTVVEADRVLRRADDDEYVRAYCLQTILTSAMIFTDYRWTSKFGDVLEKPIVQIEFDKNLNRSVLDPGVQELLKSYREALPRVIAALEKDPSPKIRLTALETISQIVSSRYRLCKELQDKHKDILPRSELLKEFNAPDPIEPLLAGQWVVIPAVLKQTDDVRLKRGVMSLLERVAEDVEATLKAKKQEKAVTAESIRQFVHAVTPALSDPDRYVRWTAARTFRYISPEYLDGEIVVALGRMLIDPHQRDADLSAAAAITIEAMAPSPSAAKAVAFLRPAIADSTMDAENRILSMKALVAISRSAANEWAVNEAFPELIIAVAADEARIRREACLTLGQLGAPRHRRELSRRHQRFEDRHAR